MGVAATVFGATAAFMVSLAFLFQGQSATWFIRINDKYKNLPEIGRKYAEKQTDKMSS